MSIEQKGAQNLGLRAATAKLLYAAAERLDGVRPIEKGLRRAVAKIHIVNDFNDDRSPEQCNQVIDYIFEANGILYERPHIISDVEQFNITHGAFEIYDLVNNWRRLGRRPGIFVGVVDPTVGSNRRGIVVTTEEECTFIGPDNGLFSPVLKTLMIKHAYNIIPGAFKDSSVTFHGRDQFTPLAAEIASGGQVSALAHLEEIDPKTLIQRDFVDNQVVEVDGYNVKIWRNKERIPRNNEGERARYATVNTPRWIRPGLLWSRRIKIPVGDRFTDVADGEWLILPGSSGIIGNEDSGPIEIAIRERFGKQGPAERLKIRVGDILNLSWEF